MLFSKETTFDRGQIRKYVGAFGSLFTGLYIKREDPKTKGFELVEVPVRFANASSYATVDQGVKEQRVNAPVPMISFELRDWDRDPVRKVSPYTRLTSLNSSNESSSGVNYQLSRVPYDFSFSVTVRTKNLGDMFQIVEQICPAFDPPVSLQIIDDKDMDFKQDITVKLVGNTFNDNFADSMEQQRYIEVDMEFVLKGYLYKVTREAPVVLETVFKNQFGDQFTDWFGNNDQNTTMTQVATIDTIESIQDTLTKL